MRWLRRAFLPHGLNEFCPLLAQNPLHATDRVAFAVQQMANAAQEIDVVRTVIAPAAAAFHRFDFGKPAFPEAQHVLRQVEVVGDLADGTKCIRRLVIQSSLHCRVYVLRSTGNKCGRQTAGSAWPLMRCFRIAEGLNTMTRRGEIGTSMPVFGLRPIRWPFLRTTKEPKDDSLTVSPRSRQSVISLSTNSTREADSVRERPTF